MIEIFSNFCNLEQHIFNHDCKSEITLIYVVPSDIWTVWLKKEAEHDIKS